MKTESDGPSPFADTTSWDEAWISIRFRGIDGHKVSYLRWFSAAGVDRLVVLLAEDDPILKRVGLDDEVGVAPVRGRGMVERSRQYFPAKLDVLNESEVDWINQELNQKYAGRRWVLRPAFWLVRIMDGTRRRRTDVPIQLELISTRSPDKSDA